MSRVYLSIDQGTTSSRAIVFNLDTGDIIAHAQKEFTQYFPNSGWVEHDGDEIWDSVCSVANQALLEAEKAGANVVGIGITNQRETTLIWDRKSGTPIYRAIVWQDRRTSKQCQALIANGREDEIADKAGLVIDPYFSASKIAWILDNVDGARARAEKGELAFGTIETFLIWRLTNGKRHISDATNASRTSLLNIKTAKWDKKLCALFNVPMAVLPEITDCAGNLGSAKVGLTKQLPILSAIGDQQSAAVGQACFYPGTVKATFGTGCFVILNTGEKIVKSSNRLLTTIGLQINQKQTYAMEGSICIAGAVVQWLRDGIGLLDDARQSEKIVSELKSNHGLYMVPAFTGLGAPYWSPDARGAIYGITRDTGPEHFIRAALEAVAYQTNDLISAMAQDGVSPTNLKVDGGMAANNWLMQFLSDIIDITVERPSQLETTALGAAMLAGVADGRFSAIEDTALSWNLDRRFHSNMVPSTRRNLTSGWYQSVMKTRLSVS
ncbi:MAG: glycerol kinase GlpK [Alphaproteobacteria bacterium]|nr:glycerol kinase GlpK [Alphaproteobacteria bacterium]